MMRRVIGALLLFVASAGLRLEGIPPATPQTCDEVPAPPTGVSAIVRTTLLTLTWKAPPSGSPREYNVEFGNAPGSTYLGTVDTGSPATLFAKALSPGIYYVRVRAKNGCGLSQLSPEVRVTVDALHIGPRTSPDVVVARRTATRNTYFPTAERLRNGHILVVYYDSPDHVSPAGRISMVQSLDGGLTWSASRVVIDGPRDERDPSIIQTTQGTLLINYFEADATQAPTSQGAFVIRSDDEGQTWSSPLKIDTMLRGAATSAKIVEMENGDLLVPLYGQPPDGGGAVATVVRSSDRGRSWPKEQEVKVAAAPGIDFMEPALANLGDGRLLAMLRTGGSDRTAFESHSLDGGRTWPAPTKTAFSAEASDLLPLGEGRGRNLLVHAWGDTSGRFGDSRPTMMQVIRFSDFPLVRRADRPRLLYQGHCWSDEGQPSSVLLDGGRIFTVYYDACAGYIGGTFSSLSDPAAPEDCRSVPFPPSNLRVVFNRGGTVALSWNPTRAPHTSYILEAGGASGAADVTDVDLGSATTFSASQVRSATYYVRVRSRNACGTGGASNEVVVVVR